MALADAAAAVGVLAPHLCSDAARLAVGVAADLPPGPAVGPIHGDCSPDQFLLSPRGISVVDLDAAVIGDPRDDLGHMAAALQVAELDGRYGRLTAEVAWNSFLGGYAAVAPLPGGIDVHTAAWLLRLAAEPFRLRRPDWPARTAAILDLARRARPPC